MLCDHEEVEIESDNDDEKMSPLEMLVMIR
jgi:hypothetical protein